MKKLYNIFILFLSVLSVTSCKEKEGELCASDEYLQCLYPLWSPLYTTPCEEGFLCETSLFYYYNTGFKIKKEDTLTNPNQYILDVLFIATKYENPGSNIQDDGSITNPFAIQLDVYSEDTLINDRVTYSIEDFSLEKYKYQEGDFDLCTFSFNKGTSVYYPIDIKTFKNNNFKIEITTYFYQFENSQKVIKNSIYIAEINYNVENNNIFFSFLSDNHLSIK